MKGFNMWIDLRSDTVTKPSDQMRRAMASAEVGDDVYGDDPTLNRLEDLAAQMLGKEAGVFVPSGTFANQLAIMTHTQRGDEILVGNEAHIMIHEVGGAALLSGVQTRTYHSPFGLIDIEELERLIRGNDIHFPKTGLICIENAHSAGTVIPLSNMKSLWTLAQRHKIPVHIDGARLFNAATALKADIKDLSQYGDTISLCLSKGLGAPVGSLLLGREDFIRKARKNRKVMGGGMRQAGILGAAGIIALNEMTKRLINDHNHAHYLADQLKTIDGFQVYDQQRDINMVFFKLSEEIISEKNLVTGLYQQQIKINGMENNTYRFVTHLNISKKDIDYLISAIKKLI